MPTIAHTSDDVVLHSDNNRICPICFAEAPTRLLLEIHVWQKHSETVCCLYHATKSRSRDVKKCHGKLSMAACATRHAFAEKLREGIRP